jgi:hypothetical protein
MRFAHRFGGTSRSFGEIRIGKYAQPAASAARSATMPQRPFPSRPLKFHAFTAIVTIGSTISNLTDVPPRCAAR